MSEKKGESKVEEPTLYYAVDVEKKGAGFEYPTIQVGYAHSTSIDVKPVSGSFCFNYAKVPFEPKCHKEFWSKNLDIYARIFAEAKGKDPVEEWKKYAASLDKLEEKHDKIEIVSDNPAYDIEAVDYHLFKDANHIGKGALPPPTVL